MEVNDYINVQTSIVGSSEKDGVQPVDQSDATAVALDMAKRRREAPVVDAPVIPSAGATPVPN